MPFYKQGDKGAIEKIADQRMNVPLTEAEIITILPSGRATVKLRGSNQIFPVETSDGKSYSPGQKVTMMRSVSSAGKWVILSTYNQAGGSAVVSNNASPGSSDPLAPPKNITVVSTVNQINLQWTPSGPRNDVTYEVQVSSNNPQTSILATTQVSGSSFTYNVPTGVTYYFAVRTIDSSWNRSGFSPVVSGTSVFASGIGADYTYDITFTAPGSITPLTVSTDVGIKAISAVLATQSSGMNGTWRIYIGSTDIITPDQTDASFIGVASYSINYRSVTGYPLQIDLSSVTGSGTITLKVTVNP